MPEGLKPCPFCGGENVDCYSVGTGFGDAWAVLCRSCGASTKGTCESRVEAIGLWSRRAERTCRNLYERHPDWEFQCSACGCNLDKFAEGFAVMDRDHEWRYCPHCGARVVAS